MAEIQRGWRDGDSSPATGARTLASNIEISLSVGHSAGSGNRGPSQLYLALEMDVGGPAKPRAQSHGSHVTAIQFFQRNDFSLWYRVVHGNSHRDFQP